MTSTTATSAPENLLGLSRQLLGVFSQSSSFREGCLRALPSNPSQLQVRVVRNVRDVDENTTRCYAELSLLDVGGTGALQWTALPLGRSLLPGGPKVVLGEVSPSGRRSISFYNAPLGKAGGADTSCSFVEVEDATHGTYRVDLSKAHGKVVGDAWFGGLSWSPDENYVLYVAQTKPVAKKTTIDSLTALGALEAEKEAGGDKFLFSEDWGEKYVDVSELALFVLSLLDGSVKQVPTKLNDVTPGQPTFVESSVGLHVAFTAWNTFPRKLGMIYCYQRKSTVHITSDLSAWLSAEGKESIESLANAAEVKQVSEGLELARSPRGAAELRGSLLLLGSRKGFLSHNGCVALYCADIDSLFNTSSTKSSHVGWLDCIVDIVEDPDVIRRKDALGSGMVQVHKSLQFPGIFCDQLPKKCVLDDGKTVLLTTMWGECETLLEVSLEGKSFRRHRWHDQQVAVGGCFSLLDIHRDVVLGVCSTPVSPSQLVAFKVNQDIFATLAEMSSAQISSKGGVPKAQLPIPVAQNWTFASFSHEAEDGVMFGSFLIHPKSMDRSRPLIVVPHGGPHSVTPSSFVASYLFLAVALNACILHVNYRGSTGFGQKSIDSLLGNVGSNDVADMMQALTYAKHLFVDPSTAGLVSDMENVYSSAGLFADASTVQGWTKVVQDDLVAVVGGSHGGFLGAHLSGQHGSHFKACCLRNPVTNIPSMVSVSDIPDWCHVESLSHVDTLYPDICQPEDLVQMHKASPVAHLDSYCVPTLICLGAKDRRVPASQGVEFYHMLRKRNIPTKLLVFPEDVHAIDQPASEAEHWIAIASWIQLHLSPSA